ncbi:MFS transporter [Thalassovita mangrovi]|uniref:MFS transporter n=1 Tax=Thalassovita mangrovi TaxID=2692236 RepID=A0A6L8LMB0_9RHOB|nr:MFS transporter [Thalassovita mangrovi]MYM57005.1 MFS transporter [Thalassovita mangrovi]
MSHILLKSNRNYRLIFSASAVSNLGDGVSSVAMPWLATLLTRDPLLISAVAMAQRLPWFLFALPAGVWTDRADRRRLMVRADLVRLALTLCITGMVLSAAAIPPATGGTGMILTLALISFLLGTAEVIRDNAAQTVMPSLVRPDDLEQANGQMWSAEQITNQFIGPPLAGVLIGAGIALPFGVDAATFALSAALIWLIALPPSPTRSRARFWPALVEGLSWMRRNRKILRLALMLAAINAVFIGGMTILVLYAQEVLGLSAAGYGLLLTCGAAGGVLGGLTAPRLARRIGMRASLMLALFAFMLLQLLLGLFSSVTLAGIALFLEAAGGMLWNVVTVSYRQRRIPDQLLGRVNSVYRFFGWGAMPFGALGAGALVAALEPGLGRIAALHAPYLISAAICFLLLLYGFLKLRFDEV